MTTTRQTITSAILSTAGAALAVTSLSGGFIAPLFSELKEIISMDGMLEFLDLAFFRAAGAVLGLSLFMFPWLQERAGPLRAGIGDEKTRRGRVIFLPAACALALVAVLAVQRLAF